MNFAELIEQCFKEMKDGGYFFHIVPLEVSKSCGKKPAILKLQITDEIAEHLFNELDNEARFAICIPKEIFLKVREEDIKEAEKEQ